MHTSRWAVHVKHPAHVNALTGYEHGYQLRITRVNDQGNEVEYHFEDGRIFHTELAAFQFLYEQGLMPQYLRPEVLYG